jgi:hypothetical protein
MLSPFRRYSSASKIRFAGTPGWFRPALTSSPNSRRRAPSSCTGRGSSSEGPAALEFCLRDTERLLLSADIGPRDGYQLLCGSGEIENVNQVFQPDGWFASSVPSDDRATETVVHAHGDHIHVLADPIDRSTLARQEPGHIPPVRKAGLRAKKIALLTWWMTNDTQGEIGRAICLQDSASKGRSGRMKGDAAVEKPKINFREIFRVVRFSTFATISAKSGSAHCS